MGTTFGQIVSAEAGEAQVRLAGDIGDTTIVLSLGSYTAVVGDKVMLAKIGKAWAILGKLDTVTV